MRLYIPREIALTGGWAPPSVTKMQRAAGLADTSITSVNRVGTWRSGLKRATGRRYFCQETAADLRFEWAILDLNQ